MVTLLCKLLLPGMTVNFEIIMIVTQHVFSIKLQNGVNIEAIKLFNPICIKSFKIANLSVMFCSLKQVTSQQHQKSFVNPFAFFPLKVCMKTELYMWISRKIYLAQITCGDDHRKRIILEVLSFCAVFQHLKCQ